MALSPLFIACEGTPLNGEISPDEPTTQDDLALALDDTNGQVNTITWAVNGKAQPALEGATLVPAGLTEKGDIWEATVEGPNARFSVSSTIRNSPPIAGSTAIEPESPGAADTLSCVPDDFSDADNDPASWQYLWQVNDQDAGEAAVLEAELTVGDQVSCTAWPIDPASSGAGVSATVVIGNTAPTISSVTITPLSPSTESDLSYEAVAEDIDGDEVSFIAEWQVNGELVHSGPTLASAYFERDDEVRVTLSPADGIVGGPSVQARTMIENASPTLVELSMDPSSPDGTDRVHALLRATDPDGDTLHPVFSWWVNDVEITDGPVLPPGLTQRGDRLEVRASISDGEFTELGQTWVRVANAAPSIPTVIISPENGPVAGVDDLVCEVLRPSVDPDGDTVTYNILWTREGMPYLGEQSESVIAGDTVSADVLEEGDNWSCLMNAGDGVVETFASASTTVLTCSSSVEVFVATTSASVDPSDSSAIEEVGISASEDSQAWLLFDFSGLPERSFVTDATLSVHTQSSGVVGGPSVHALASATSGWTASSPTVGVGQQVSEGQGGIDSEEWVNLEIDVNTWGWGRVLRNQAGSMGIATGERESSVSFYGESETGKEPTLTLTLTICE
ncbi:MAG: hypothetical protein ACI9VR_004829 [Cognaticolwellia sp.]|jgi:hypothetical protein